MNIPEGLPVRSLDSNLIQRFETITPDFISELIFETEFNGLQKAIGCGIKKTAITTVAEITPEKQIVIYENYKQFLWSITYVLLYLFKEKIKKPLLKGMPLMNLRDGSGNNTLNLLANAYRLFNHYIEIEFWSLPNPQYNSSEVEEYYSNKANSVYLDAMVFTLLHEFGHQYYGHLDAESPASSTDSKRRELDCDDFAFEKISARFCEHNSTGLKLGMIVALTGLYFLDSRLDGGLSHPDPDERLDRQINKLCLDDADDLWGIAALSFYLWAHHNTIEIPISRPITTFRDLYLNNMGVIQQLKQEHI